MHTESRKYGKEAMEKALEVSKSASVKIILARIFFTSPLDNQQ